MTVLSEPAEINPSLPVQNALIVHAVGECLMAWAMAEETVHELFVQQLVTKSENPNRYTVARSVWFCIIGFDSRLKMADAAIKGNITDAATLADWRLLLNYTTKMSSLRNEAAHGMLANFDNKEMKIMPYGTDMLKRTEPLTIAELKRRTELFVELEKALSWFQWSASNQIKPNPHFGTIPVPELVTALRKQAAKTRKGQAK
jgi:hypothetical protein